MNEDILQKYLEGKATIEDKEILLDNALKTLNVLKEKLNKMVLIELQPKSI